MAPLVKVAAGLQAGKDALKGAAKVAVETLASGGLVSPDRSSLATVQLPCTGGGAARLVEVGAAGERNQAVERSAVHPAGAGPPVPSTRPGPGGRTWERSRTSPAPRLETLAPAASTSYRSLMAVIRNWPAQSAEVVEPSPQAVEVDSTVSLGLDGLSTILTPCGEE